MLLPPPIGGGGGGGGGVVVIAAKVLNNSGGTIEANGGDGADGTDGNATGGGGGGGGGAVILISDDFTSGTEQALAGGHVSFLQLLYLCPEFVNFGFKVSWFRPKYGFGLLKDTGQTANLTHKTRRYPRTYLRAVISYGILAGLSI